MCQKTNAFMRRFFHDAAPRPRDFEQVVKIVLATFAVFTGFVFSTYIKEELTLKDINNWLDWLAWFGDWRFWAFLALMALMLRYIIGSAIHLNFMYVLDKSVPGATGSRSQSRFFLFKDLVFLVIFGLIAMSIATAANKTNGSIDVFMRRSMLFIGAGFTWSLVDVTLRFLWGLKWANEKPGYFWIIWMTLDAAQFGVTALVLHSGANELHKAEWLAAIYSVFLFLDIMAMVRAVQIHDPPAPAKVGA